MLALRRLRCLLHSIPSSQTRCLRTQPREIPTYARRWDPSRHEPLRSTKAPNEPRRNTPEQDPRKDTIDAPREPIARRSSTEDIVIRFNSRNPQIAHNIRRLQYLLNLANHKDDLNWTLRAPLWRAYSLAKEHKVTVTTYLSQRAWNVLWKSQYADFFNVDRRKAHLAELDRDLLVARGLLAAKIDPIAGQVAYHIEEKFMAGEEQAALEEWETSRHEFPMTPEYLDVGARLYGLAGLPDQARAIMDDLLKLDPNWDLSVMMAVFRAYTSSELKQHHKEAKEIYYSMKARIGSNGAIETYDSCMIGFLEARSLPDAKEVFRDMVREGCLGTEGSVSHVREVLRRLNLLYTLGTDISRMTSIALDAIAVLPPAYHGHVFGDWMKSAVVENAPQAAAQVFDMMIQRGCEPETFHFNLLLRALLRTKEPENILKAENLGWKMIEEARESMRKERPAPHSRVKAIDRKLKDVSALNANPTIAVPAATVSTFALIMRHHAQSLQWEHVDYLARQLKFASVEPNCTIMNVLIDNKCRQGKFVEAFQIYKSLTDNPDSSATVFPDGQSIRCLWKTLRLALADPVNREDPNLPTPRELLRETTNWWTQCRSRYDADRFLQGLAAADRGAIMGLILHCFSYLRDLPGSLIALHVLRLKFGIRPTKKTAEILRRQLAWVDMHGEIESVRMQLGRSNSNARNMERLSHTYGQLKQRRLQDLNITPDTLEKYSKEDMGDIELDVISEFVRLVLLANYPPEIVEAMIDGARNAVGLPNLPTGHVFV
ncbi:hypothetical protein BU25DRAFT_410566 [Macroventuria anomochaeta]|uniref:Uncharacterized protein n=1 Tax=Macroventuria anomochaeta TaxID=301207 RepID=A0ACB6S1A3_9PLEO|nr:uncharacterized protein BU25DRAFT_410566 [Macroventuria anomochaeta]KAF2627931.1 hypothetical protein BU25DRAFT_410566 [Macroventuria anomochaeta]